MLNWPNALAFSRVLMSPLMLYVMLTPELFTDAGFHVSWVSFTAAFIFTVASITDFFDGYIARELDQITPVGKILDPLADKMLTFAAFFGLMMTDQASVWAIYIIVVRELFISGLRTVAVQQGLDVASSWSGKVKTVIQMFAIGFLLMGWWGGEILLWLAVAATLYSGLEYTAGYAKNALKATA
ncbi:MAG: CDP-diacylglycerol--glycerol-3-phosphate 3-phosphatidyltransferase [Sulfuricurvum sp. PC08-66]|nr:MAG: CDP-diacylglycerol--glycerol-3-phosphate 3-phosphatidyltransferase [Sulfuricurvum sp. PC08-66]